MEKILIIANWKMNPGSSNEVRDLAETVKLGVAGVSDARVVLCPPFVYLAALMEGASAFAQGFGGLAFGSQDCFWEETGAFTGEVSPSMLKNLGCSYVILGHSERKKYLGETLEMVSKKVKATLTAGLIPVVCIGEHIRIELQKVLKDLNLKDRKRLVLVYEPEWAISTASNAKPDTPEHAQKAIAQIREIAGSDVPVLYGGSTNSKNIRGFIEAGAQGALVGSASLDAKEFIELVRNAVSA